jgi:hypothetical protein
MIKYGGYARKVMNERLLYPAGVMGRAVSVVLICINGNIHGK